MSESYQLQYPECLPFTVYVVDGNLYMWGSVWPDKMLAEVIHHVLSCGGEAWKMVD